MKNPLHYQLSEYDCGPTSLLNAMSYLFAREEIPPEIIRNIMLYCLDLYGDDGGTGKSGTSHTAMMFLSNWLNGYGSVRHFPISSRYLVKEEVYLSQDSLICDALYRGGAVVLRVFLDEWHYVLLTGVEENRVLMFDPYYWPDLPKTAGVLQLTDQPFRCNRSVEFSVMNRDCLELYALGPVDVREALLLFNGQTMLTQENTVEYII